MKNLFDIKNKVVVITGGTGVLGSCMSHYLAEQGARVAIIGRSKEKGEPLVEAIRKEGYTASFYSADVLDQAAIEQVRDEILKTYKKVDVLINGAGGNMPGATIGPTQTIFDLKVDDFKKVVDLNLFGTIIPTNVFVKVMVDGGAGNIVNISSESALRPLTRVVGYGAAKAAIINYTKYMAGEMGAKFGEKFRVNALVPGFFLTEQNRNLLTNPDGSHTDRAKTILAHTPFNRFGEADELLGSLHYLISDASKFVTGTSLVIDGGFDAFSI